jgi:pimeloyl-ACP methyl ester carboxylesterase
VRTLADRDLLTPEAAQLAAFVYGFAGPKVLRRQLDLLLGGRQALWSALGGGVRFLLERKAPYRHEPDLVGRIGYRELNYAAAPDGKPLDPAVAFHEFTSGPTQFEAEPFNLAEEMPKFSWPAVIVSGGRDLITPPAVASRIAALIPDAVLVTLATAGHSALDLRERAALDIVKAVYDGTSARLPERADELDATPGGLGVRALMWGIAAAAAVEQVVPAAVPRVVHRVTAS